MLSNWTLKEHKLLDCIQAITLENERWELTLLPEKGGEIHQIICKRTRNPLLYINETELKRFQQDRTSGVESLLHSYMFAGFIMMFPNGGEESQYKGIEYDYHGDIRHLPWSCEISSEKDEIVVHLDICSQQLPLVLHRTIRCELDKVVFEDRINRSDTIDSGLKLPFIYGLHPYFTSPLLDEESGIIKLGGKQILQMPMIDYAEQELLFLTEKERGLIEVFNSKLSLGFTLEYDTAFMPYVWLYIDKHETKDQRILSLIPCTTDQHDGIQEAIKRNNAVWIEPGQVLITKWSIAFQG